MWTIAGGILLAFFIWYVVIPLVFWLFGLFIETMADWTSRPRRVQQVFPEDPKYAARRAELRQQMELGNHELQHNKREAERERAAFEAEYEGSRYVRERQARLERRRAEYKAGLHKNDS